MNINLFYGFNYFLVNMVFDKNWWIYNNYIMENEIIEYFFIILYV